MLPAQVSYWSLLETNRHNIATERQAANELVEVTRHNKVTESQAAENIRLGWANLNETHRHNVVTENETHRANVVREQQNFMSLAETQRHNIAYETETSRHNQNVEAISRQSNAIQYSLGMENVAVAQANANTARLTALSQAKTNATQAAAAWNNSITNKRSMLYNYDVQTTRNQIEMYKAETSRNLQFYNALSSISSVFSNSTKTLGEALSMQI